MANEHWHGIIDPERPFGLGRLKPCANPECDRATPEGVLYCCGACGKAHDGKYEIHEEGILGHSPDCNQRHERRSKLLPARRAP